MLRNSARLHRFNVKRTGEAHDWDRIRLSSMSGTRIRLNAKDRVGPIASQWSMCIIIKDNTKDIKLGNRNMQQDQSHNFKAALSTALGQFIYSRLGHGLTGTCGTYARYHHAPCPRGAVIV